MQTIFQGHESFTEQRFSSLSVEYAKSRNHLGPKELAILLDAEGCITIRPMSGATARSPRLYIPRIRIVNRSREMLDEVLIYVGAGSITLEVGRGRRRSIWSWEVAARLKVLGILESVEPYLRAKRAIARRVCEYIRYAPGLTHQQQRDFYLSICALQMRQPALSRNGTGTCQLHRDLLQKRKSSGTSSFAS